MVILADFEKKLLFWYLFSFLGVYFGEPTSRRDLSRKALLVGTTSDLRSAAYAPKLNKYLFCYADAKSHPGKLGGWMDVKFRKAAAFATMSSLDERSKRMDRRERVD